MHRNTGLNRCTHEKNRLVHIYNNVIGKYVALLKYRKLFVGRDREREKNIISLLKKVNFTKLPHAPRRSLSSSLPPRLPPPRSLCICHWQQRVFQLKPAENCILYSTLSNQANGMYLNFPKSNSQAHARTNAANVCLLLFGCIIHTFQSLGSKRLKPSRLFVIVFVEKCMPTCQKDYMRISSSFRVFCSTWK